MIDWIRLCARCCVLFYCYVSARCLVLCLISNDCAPCHVLCLAFPLAPADCFVPFIMFSKCACANSLRLTIYHMEDTMTIFSNIWIEVSLLVKSAELSCKYERDLSHMV